MRYKHVCTICGKIWGHSKCTAGGNVGNWPCPSCIKQSESTLGGVNSNDSWEYEIDPFVKWTREIQEALK